GTVALILDIPGLSQRAGVVSPVREPTVAEAGSRQQARADASQPLLLVRAGAAGQVAIPLSMVTRLETFPLTAVEKAQNQEAVQYRGRILPLIRLSHVVEAAASGSAPPVDPLPVVIYSEQGRCAGLVV